MPVPKRRRYRPRIDYATAAARAGATAHAAAVVGHPGVGDDAELALREVLAVQIEVDGVLSGQKRPAGGIADASAEDRALLERLTVWMSSTLPSVLPSGRDIGRIDPVLIVIEIEEAIVEDHAPADEQNLRDVEDVGGTGERGAVLGAVDELDILELRAAGACAPRSSRARFAFCLALGVFGAQRAAAASAAALSIAGALGLARSCVTSKRCSVEHLIVGIKRNLVTAGTDRAAIGDQRDAAEIDGGLRGPDETLVVARGDLGAAGIEKARFDLVVAAFEARQAIFEGGIPFQILFVGELGVGESCFGRRDRGCRRGSKASASCARSPADVRGPWRPALRVSTAGC